MYLEYTIKELPLSVNNAVADHDRFNDRKLRRLAEILRGSRQATPVQITPTLNAKGTKYISTGLIQGNEIRRPIRRSHIYTTAPDTTL